MSVDRQPSQWGGWLRERGGIALCGLAVVVFAWESRAVHPHLDDSYITYQYARNLVEGHGLVFNVGEYVEGFTNLLWTLLIAGGLALGFEATTVGHLLENLEATDGAIYKLLFNLSRRELVSLKEADGTPIVVDL